MREAGLFLAFAAAGAAATRAVDTTTMPTLTWMGENRVPAVYITLRQNATERNDTIARNLQRIGVEASPFLVDKHPKGSVVGIFRSHTRALRHLLSLNPPSRLYLVFEDDAIPGRQYSVGHMEAILTELQGKGDDWDMAYLGTNIWNSLLWYSPPWHRYTEHTIDKAWSQMHAVLYSRAGLLKVVPILEARLAELELPGADPQHIDLYLESFRPDVKRHLVVPYMFDQNWTIPSENVDRCAAMAKCGDSAEDNEILRQLQLGRHEWWAGFCYEVGRDAGRFWVLYLLAIFLCIGFGVACVYVPFKYLYMPRRWCFAHRCFDNSWCRPAVRVKQVDYDENAPLQPNAKPARSAVGGLGCCFGAG